MHFEFTTKYLNSLKNVFILYFYFSVQLKNTSLRHPEGCGFEPPDNISSPLFSIQCFSFQLCSYYACDVLCVFVVV